jgi:hypothetical protein
MRKFLNVAAIALVFASTTPVMSATKRGKDFRPMTAREVGATISGKQCHFATGGSSTFGADGSYRSPSGRTGRYRISGTTVHINFDDGVRSWYEVGRAKANSRWVVIRWNADDPHTRYAQTMKWKEMPVPSPSGGRLETRKRLAAG